MTKDTARAGATLPVALRPKRLRISRAELRTTSTDPVLWANAPQPSPHSNAGICGRLTGRH
ncbi:MAG: hypothetical protein RJR37_09910 [Peptococcaceae bacterium MAG4]|nr:hypothetical protein [Peptococcaceae bacterium MAG4]